MSNNRFNERSEDIIILGVTSNISKGEYAIPLDNKSLEEGKLTTDCIIKVENILRLDRHLILKRIGKVKKDKLLSVIKVLNSIFIA